MAIAWDVADPAACKGWKILRASGPNETEGMLAIISDTMPLPVFPAQQTLLIDAANDHCIELTVHGPLEPRGLSPFGRATLMIDGDRTPTDREQALIDQGMATEIFTGPRPSGLRFPKEAKNIFA